MYQDWNGVRELESTLLHKARKVVEGVLHGELEESQRIEELLRSINEPPELEEGSSLSATTTTPTTPKDIDINIATDQEWGRCDNEHYYIDESGFVLPLKPRMECENGNWILYFDNEQGVVVNVDIGAGIESYHGRKKMLEQREAYQGNVVKLG